MDEPQLAEFDINYFDNNTRLAIVSLILAFRRSQKTLEAVCATKLRDVPHAVENASESVTAAYMALYYICRFHKMESPVEEEFEVKRNGGKTGYSLVDVQA